MISRRIALVIAAVAAFAFGPSAANAGLVIDDFSQVAPQFLPILGSGSVASDQGGIPGANTIGGHRRLDLVVTSPSPFLGSTMVVDPTSPGILSLSDDATVSSISMVTWDSNGAGLGGVDLTAGGDHFLVNIPFQDLDATLTFDLTTGSGVLSTSIPGALGATLIPFADFGGPGDFTDVDSIKLTITGLDALDLQIDFIGITSVPEPVGMSIWAVAMAAGLAGFRRQRKARL